MDRFDNLDEHLDDPLVEDSIPFPERRRRRRLPKCTEAFVMVPVSWIAEEGLFNSRGRLWLFLLNESRYGTRPVRLTEAEASKARVAGTTKDRCLRKLEKQGRVCLERAGHSAPTVVVIPGALFEW
jgi:hypothetical protein